MLVKGVVTTGSNEVAITFSGCRLLTMDAPLTGEGTQEWNMTVKPQNAFAEVIDAIQTYTYHQFAA